MTKVLSAFLPLFIQPQGPLLEAQDVPIQAWPLAAADAGSQEHISKNLEALFGCFLACKCYI